MQKSRKAVRPAARHAIALCVAVLVTWTAARECTADDLGAATRELQSAPDFRVRVSAALALGKTRDDRSLGPLVKALDDRHPAVRAAAAAGIGALGADHPATATPLQVQGLPALRRRAARERSPSVQTRLAAAIAELEKLEPVAAARAPRVLVKLGQLQSVSGARAPRLSSLFRGATRKRAGALPGVEVLSEESEAASEEQTRQLPVLMLDGVVIRLARSNEGDRVNVSAQVEYVFRKVPEHALRASFTGAAKASGGARAVTDRAAIALLEDQALQGAVESAMRGAPEVMSRALGSGD